MKAFLQLCGRGARTLCGWMWSFALWSLWLALCALLVVQLYVATAHELALPAFVLRQIESRLAESGLRATFASTSFDPTGRVLVQDVKLSLPSFSEPVITARAVYVRVNPLLLIVGVVEPREIRIDDATATIPALLSPSGRAEELVRGLHVTLEPARRSLVFRQLDARAAGVTVTARGVLPLPREAEARPADALARFLAREFPALCRQAVAWSEQLARFEDPSIDLELAPSESGAAAIGITVLARRAQFDQPIAARVVDLRASTRLLLFGDVPAAHVELSAGELHWPEHGTLRGVHALVLGRVRAADRGFDLREVLATVDAATIDGVAAQAISAQVHPRPLPRVNARVVGHFAGSALAVQADADYEARTAQVAIAGSVGGEALALVGERTRVDVRRFFDFDAFEVERAEVRLAPGWKFAQLAAQIRSPLVRAYGVALADARARLELTGTRFQAPEAFARIGENFARGSYEHDLATNEYRFLLAGRLRPLEISRWFQPWWPRFFEQFDFAAAPPHASVDVRSVWRDGRRAQVFVFADVAQPVIRGTPLDHVRTRLFVRPGYYDALEAHARRGEGLARGRFTYTADPVTHAWQTLDLAFDSTLEAKTTEKLLGPLGGRIFGPFQIANAPELKVTGRFSGPAAEGGAHSRVRVQARSAGEFRFHHFPLHDVSFVASLHDDELIVDDFAATIGGGAATGRARAWGLGEQRRLGFDLTLRDAGLGPVAAAAEEFFAHHQKRAPAPPGKFVQQKANVRLRLGASAEGSYDNPLSFRGSGSAALQGAELGEVPLLGALSEVLKFTALRFTEARANFRIEGPKLVFPEITLRGANSAIDAQGEYTLDRHQLDFSARIFPFQESDSLLKSVVGVVLSPLSNAFEVKLSGTLAKPEWALALGPGNLLRALAPGDAPGKTPAAEEGNGARAPTPAAPSTVPPAKP